MSGTMNTPEHQQDGVERSGRKLEVAHVAEPELDIVEPGLLGLGPSEREQSLGHVDTEDPPIWSYLLGGRKRGGAASTRHVEDAITRTDACVLDTAAPESGEVCERLVVVVTGGGVEHRPRLLCCLVSHGRAQVVPVAYSASSDTSTSVMIVRLYARWARVDSNRAPVWERVSFQPSR